MIQNKRGIIPLDDQKCINVASKNCRSACFLPELIGPTPNKTERPADPVALRKS
jgi:hypothetical protein